MPRVSIDGREVQAPAGATVLEAARAAGVAIPTLCCKEGFAPQTSCLLCLVRVDGMRRLVPACGYPVRDGMAVEATSPDLATARRTAVELLLAEHVGDCDGPCRRTCPAQMEIPLMIRQIAAGRLSEALVTVKRHIALPAALGRVCPAPCERGCRRAQADGAVAICRLKRFVADVDLATGVPWRPECAVPSGKRVAIVGAGPAGLAAAYYLAQAGHACTLFDARAEPGGGLRHGVSREALPADVLDAEIGTILRLGVAFRSGARVGSLDELARAHDAVLATCGEGESLGLRKGPRGIAVHADTLQTDLPNVFAGGGAIGRSRKLAVWAVADGRHLAHSCDQFLRGAPVTGLPRPFHSVIGKLREGELEVFLQQADARGRVEPAAGLAGGYTAGEAAAECARCMHCDCRKREHCDLRDRATELEAHGPRYRIHGRAKVTLERRHASVVFEPGKCIKCGLCLEVARRHGEPLGLAFVGRGFEVRVAVPFDEPLSAGLKAAAADCVQICPTGALAFSGE